MANINNAINMSFRVDKELKQQADTLFRNLGLNTSVALNMFLAQCVREQALPFTPTMGSQEPTPLMKKEEKSKHDLNRLDDHYQDYQDIL